MDFQEKGGPPPRGARLVASGACPPASMRERRMPLADDALVKWVAFVMAGFSVWSVDEYFPSGVSMFAARGPLAVVNSLFG